jgi:hypothetical protein
VRYEERGQGYRDVEKVGKHCFIATPTAVYHRVSKSPKPHSIHHKKMLSVGNGNNASLYYENSQVQFIIHMEEYTRCLKSPVNGTRKQTKQKIQTN